MQVILIVLLILAVLLVIFTLQNSTEITIHLFLWDIAGVPLALVIISCIIIGYLISVIYFYPRLWKVKKEYRQLIKFNKELKELHDLNQPKTVKTPEDYDPDGIELDDDDEKNSFFKD